MLFFPNFRFRQASISLVYYNYQIFCISPFILHETFVTKGNSNIAKPKLLFHLDYHIYFFQLHGFVSSIFIYLFIDKNFLVPTNYFLLHYIIYGSIDCHTFLYNYKKCKAKIL